MSDKIEKNIIEKSAELFLAMIDGPVSWFREKVVLSNRPETYYYHEKFRRVPTIDECPYNDILCQFEATQQMYRDKIVDNKIINVLRERKLICFLREHPDVEKCDGVSKDFEDASENWFIKYGDVGPYYTAKDLYMKQKHRMIWERRQAEKSAQEQQVDSS